MPQSAQRRRDAHGLEARLARLDARDRCQQLVDRRRAPGVAFRARVAIRFPERRHPIGQHVFPRAEVVYVAIAVAHFVQRAAEIETEVELYLGQRSIGQQAFEQGRLIGGGHCIGQNREDVRTESRTAAASRR